MPIRPDLRHLYSGPEWRATRERIRERAGNKCELCHAPNAVCVLRMKGWWTASTLAATVWATNGRFTYEERSVERPDGAIVETVGKFQFIKLPWRHAGKEIGNPILHPVCFPNVGAHRWVRIVLTVAHLNHNSGDDREENLLALCQWCHLRYDLSHHRETRAKRKDAARPILQAAATPEGVTERCQ